MFIITSAFNIATSYSFGTFEEAMQEAARYARANYTAMDVTHSSGDIIARVCDNGRVMRLLNYSQYAS
jgi:hypothetical protein